MRAAWVLEDCNYNYILVGSDSQLASWVRTRINIRIRDRDRVEVEERTPPQILAFSSIYLFPRFWGEQLRSQPTPVPVSHWNPISPFSESVGNGRKGLTPGNRNGHGHGHTHSHTHPSPPPPSPIHLNPKPKYFTTPPPPPTTAPPSTHPSRYSNSSSDRFVGVYGV